MPASPSCNTDCVFPVGWAWTDHSSLGFVNWAPGEPNEAFHPGEAVDENCVEMRSDGSWNDNNCLVKRGFVCRHRQCTSALAHSFFGFSVCIFADFTLTPPLFLLVSFQTTQLMTMAIRSSPLTAPHPNPPVTAVSSDPHMQARACWWRQQRSNICTVLRIVPEILDLRTIPLLRSFGQFTPSV